MFSTISSVTKPAATASMFGKVGVCYTPSQVLFSLIAFLDVNSIPRRKMGFARYLKNSETPGVADHLKVSTTSWLTTVGT